jgi:hypothetical protein
MAASVTWILAASTKIAAVSLSHSDINLALVETSLDFSTSISRRFVVAFNL